jgi:hypothetical protein
MLSILIGLVIALRSNDELKEWISRCYFSTAVSTILTTNKEKSGNRAAPYKTATDEMNAYKSAIGV